MKTTKIIMSILLAYAAMQIMPNKAQAQQTYPGYQYSYDKSGDRTSRIYTQVYLKIGINSETITALGNYDIRISPNPTKGILKLSISNLKKDDKAQMYLSDFSGNKLFTSPINIADNVIDLSKHPNGTYFLTIVIGEQTETFKIMKVE
jgi:hypothetical protein